jgi:hypothetical protein
MQVLVGTAVTMRKCSKMKQQHMMSSSSSSSSQVRMAQIMQRQQQLARPAADKQAVAQEQLPAVKTVTLLLLHLNPVCLLG